MLDTGIFSTPIRSIPNGFNHVADVAVLVIGQAAPIVLWHLAHGDRLVVGVGDVVAELDGHARIVHVALGIEARIEGADEIVGIVVDGGRQPALGGIADAIAQIGAARVGADRRDDIDQPEREDEKQGRGSRSHSAAGRAWD